MKIRLSTLREMVHNAVSSRKRTLLESDDDDNDPNWYDHVLEKAGWRKVGTEWHQKHYRLVQIANNAWQAWCNNAWLATGSIYDVRETIRHGAER
jgi:hypothetical protein